MSATCSLYDLLADVQRFGGVDAEYARKMLHQVPAARSVRREDYLIEQAKGRCVMDIGASGPMSALVRKAAREYHSVNITDAEFCIDLDRAESLPELPGLEIVIAGEVIEHLSNAGHLLDMLRGCGCPIVITTPNAFSHQPYLNGGVECVNPEHVAWYSYHTLKVLVERHGFRLVDWCWYNGKPGTAEGLIFLIEVADG